MWKSTISSLLLLSLLSLSLVCCSLTTAEASSDGGTGSNSSTVVLNFDDFEGQSFGTAVDWASPQWSGSSKNGVSIGEYFEWCGSGKSCLRLFADGAVNQKVVTQRAANLMTLSSTKQPVSKIVLSLYCRFVTDRKTGNAGLISISNNAGKHFRTLKKLETADNNDVPTKITLEIPPSYWTFDFVMKFTSKAESTFSTDLYIDDVQVSAVLRTGAEDGESISLENADGESKGPKAEIRQLQSIQERKDARKEARIETRKAARKEARIEARIEARKEAREKARRKEARKDARNEARKAARIAARMKKREPTSPPTTTAATLPPTSEGTLAPTADGGGMSSEDTTGKTTLAPTADGTLTPTVPDAGNRKLSSDNENEGHFQLNHWIEGYFQFYRRIEGYFQLY